MSRRSYRVNVTRVLLTGKRAGSKAASEVSSPAQTGLRGGCGTPHTDPLGTSLGNRGGGVSEVRGAEPIAPWGPR